MSGALERRLAALGLERRLEPQDAGLRALLDRLDGMHDAQGSLSLDGRAMPVGLAAAVALGCVLPRPATEPLGEGTAILMDRFDKALEEAMGRSSDGQPR